MDNWDDAEGYYSKWSIHYQQQTYCHSSMVWNCVRYSRILFIHMFTFSYWQCLYSVF